MQNKPKLSIVIPAYNEKDTIDEIVRRVQNVEFEKEIIIVDDYSNDGTRDKIHKISGSNIKKLFHDKNKGKGAALISGIKKASKDWLLTIDTDISVSLLEINNWIKYKYLKINNEIYFGSRNLKNSIIKFEYHRKLIGFFLMLICKFFLNIKLYDTQCGFKLYKKKIGKNSFINRKRN